MADTLRITRNLDNRLNLNNERAYSVTQGCSNISYREYNNTSASIGNTVNITCNPPNRNIVVSRRVFKTASFTVTINGTSSTPNLLVDGYHGPSFMPLIQVTATENMTIGQAQVSQTNIAENWRAMMHYSNDMKNYDSSYSLSANFTDQAQTFQEIAQKPRSPFSTYGDSPILTNRTSLWSYEIVSNTATQAVVTFTVSEPLFLSPFVFGTNAGNMPGLVGVETMTYSATFGNLALAWSGEQKQDGTSNITSVSTVMNTFSLSFEHLTPQVNMPIPRALVCSYSRPHMVSTTISTPLGPNSLPLPLNQIRVQLEGIPRRIYLFACEAVGDFSQFKPATFIPLADQVGCVQVQMNGIPSLGTHSRRGIYELSKHNGLNMDYSQFAYYMGSVVCLDFSRDVATNPEQAPGVSQMNEFTANMIVTNTTDNRTFLSPTFYCVIIYDGIFSVTDGVSRIVTNPLSGGDVLNSPLDSSFKESNLPDDVFGGSFWDKMRGVAQRGVSFVKDNKLISRGLALAGHDEASRLAESYGLGSGGGVSGGGVSGGRLISRKQLTLAPRY